MSFEFHKGKNISFNILQLCIWLHNVAEDERQIAEPELET